MKKTYFKFSIFGIAFGLFAGAAIAQTGPGGVSATGTGTNLQLWLRADQGVYANAGITQASNGQSVTQWNDMSGNGKVGYNSNGTTRPTYSTGSVNGLPALDFNSALAQTITSGVDIRPSVMSDVTVIAVAKTNSTTAAYAKIWGHDAPTQTTGFHRGVGMDPRVTNTLGYFAGSGVYNYGNVSANTYFISTAMYTATTFAGYLNGTATASGSVICNGGLTAVSIGSLTPTGEFWNGSICEFIIFNKILSTAERQMVESYLAGKYAIGTSNDAYTMDDPANGNYDYEIAGIASGSGGTNITASQGSGILQVSSPSSIGTNQSFMFGHDNGSLTMTGPNRPAGYNSRLNRTWRPSEVGDVGTMTLSFDVSGISGAPTNASDYALVIDRDNDGLFSDETAGTGGVIAAAGRAGNTVTFTGVNIADAQRFTMAFTNSVALPVDLVSFKAAAASTQNQLSWETANAKGLSGIVLERSTDGQGYDAFRSFTVAPDGRYSAADDQPAAVSFYRLRILGQDGSSSYSGVQKVLRTDRSGTLQLSPNPASNVLHVSGLPGTSATIRLFDAMGRQILSQQTNERSISIPLTAYPAGTYILSVDADGLHAVEQVMKN